jgi:nicotinate-nucleotide pyrophosphorylase (carboxylating)
MVPSPANRNKLLREINKTIKNALNEDIGSGDVTTNAIVSPESVMSGEIIAKQSGVVAGLDVAEMVFKLLSKQVIFTASVPEGSSVENQQILARLSGPAWSLLTGERTALNFLGRMSGIATLTNQFVTAVAGTHAAILDTRKTAPGLRSLDKLAVKRGGGQNHRCGLYDMVLIKDNHIDFAGSLTEAIRRARFAHTGHEIEVEARDLRDVAVALELGVNRILLDNMEPDLMAQAVKITAGRAKLEASGNVDLDNVRKVAESGVDFISIGALTHSARVFDLSLKWVM